MRKLTAIVSVAVLSLSSLSLSGCLVAAAGVGVVASEQMLDNNVYACHVNMDAKQVWDITKKFLADQSTDLIQWDDATRVAKANIDSSAVMVSVEAFDVDKSVVHVSAKKYLATVNDGDMARIVSERLLRRIEQAEKH
jgi:hypothetical protein